MKCLSARITFIGLFAFCQTVVLYTVLSLNPAAAQTADSEPPRISFSAQDEGALGQTQQFAVSVTDNVAVDSVLFNYRFMSGEEYISGDMLRIGSTDQYGITIPATAIPVTADLIEYYIEARDAAGNRTLQGFFFDPLIRSLVENPVNAAGAAQSGQTESTSLLGSLSTTQKITYGAIGVVIIAALIAAADSGDSDEDSPGPLTNVTITIPPLGTE